MNQKKRIAALLHLHVRKETTQTEQEEIACWRRKSFENELLCLKLTDMHNSGVPG
jgi:hypothetical protein